MVAEIQVGKIFQAIPAMIAECEHISKDKRNQQQGFNYRGIDDVYRVVHPLLAKFKVFPCSSILDDQREERQTAKGGTLLYARLKMRYRFFADDGSYVDTEVIGEGMDSGDKASNKAMSIAYKYALFQLLCIPVAAIDPDSETHEVAPREAALQRLQETAKAPATNGIKNDRVQELIKMFSECKDELALDSLGQIVAEDMKAKKFTKANFEYLCSVGRQTREQLKAMAQQNEFFEKQLAGS